MPPELPVPSRLLRFNLEENEEEQGTLYVPERVVRNEKRLASRDNPYDSRYCLDINIGRDMVTAHGNIFIVCRGRDLWAKVNKGYLPAIELGENLHLRWNCGAAAAIVCCETFEDLISQWAIPTIYMEAGEDTVLRIQLKISTGIGNDRDFLCFLVGKPDP